MPQSQRCLQALKATLAAALALAQLACAEPVDSSLAPPPPAAPSLPQARAAAETTQATATDAPAEPKVAFLGDSISAGLHLPAHEAYPAVLERRLRAAGHGFKLLNAGVSGDTTAGGLRRVDWLLKQRPQLVVIELGANDGLRGIALTSIENNLRGIIDKVRAAGALPLLLGMRLPPSYGANYAGGFDSIYPRLAKELSVPFVPFFMREVAGVPTMNLEDGIHPTPEGHRRLAGNLHDALLSTLQSAPTTPTSGSP